MKVRFDKLANHFSDFTSDPFPTQPFDGFWLRSSAGNSPTLHSRRGMQCTQRNSRTVPLVPKYQMGLTRDKSLHSTTKDTNTVDYLSLSHLIEHHNKQQTVMKQFQIFLIALCVTSSLAVLKKFSNPQGGGWDVDGNWEPTGVPHASDDG